MSGIGIITNPHSKLNKRNPNRTALLGFILGAQGQLEVTNTLADLGRVAEEFKAKGINTLAINGGDGTICRTLTAFLQAYGDTPLPQVALLRGGTINVLANNLGIKGTPEQVLYRLVEWHASGQKLPLRKLRTLMIGDTHGFLFGNGAAASFLEEYYKRKSGPFGAFLMVIGVFISRLMSGELYDRVIRDFPVKLAPAGGEALAHTSCAVFAATVPKLPLGYPLFHQLRGRPAAFQCVSFTFPARDAVWRVPYVLATRQDGPGKGKISFCCQDLQIEMPEPFDYTLDGELYKSASNKLQIGIGPEIDFVTI